MSDDIRRAIKDLAPTITWVTGLAIVLLVAAIQWGFLGAALATGIFFTVVGVAADLYGTGR